MAIPNIDNIQWFFICRKCKPRLVSDNYPSKEIAENMEKRHIKIKHSE